MLLGGAHRPNLYGVSGHNEQQNNKQQNRHWDIVISDKIFLDTIVSIGDTFVSVSHKVNYLGVIFDENCKLHLQIGCFSSIIRNSST